MNDLVLVTLFSVGTLATAIMLGLEIIIRAAERRNRDEPEVNEGVLDCDLRNFVVDLNTERGR